MEKTKIGVIGCGKISGAYLGASAKFDILQAVGLATAAGILAAALLLRWRSSGVLAAGAVAAGLVGVLAAGSDAHWYGQLIAALAGTVSHLTARLLLDGTRTRLTWREEIVPHPHAIGRLAAPLTDRAVRSIFTRAVAEMAARA